jgi:N-acetylmuramoyl-L-alanine amidase
MARGHVSFTALSLPKILSRRGVRGLLVLAAVVVALPFVPLPRACDPRLEELPDGRYAELLRFADTRTRREIEEALRLVDPRGLLRPYLTLDDKTLEVRLEPGDRAPVVRVGLRATPATTSPRAWRRIVLDPGHSGGAWSLSEQRHTSRDGRPPVREGDLTWATARLVEQRLRERGLEVQLTRGPPPEAPYPAEADPAFDLERETGLWLSERHRVRPPWLAPLWAHRLWREGQDFARDRPFEVYTHYDLRRRGAVAERFDADVTLSLHYNFTRSELNGVLVFVQGNALPDELATASQRFWALRHVLAGSLPETRRLASALGRELMRGMDLPALPMENDADLFASRLPVDPSHGVYARNLAVLRRSPGIALMLEGPCLSQRDEYQRMQGTEIEVDGRRYPDRVRQYAEAVAAGLIARE